MSERADSRIGAAKTGQSPAILWQVLNGLWGFFRVEQCIQRETFRFQAALIVTGRCNQRCPFCQANLDDSAADPPAAKMLAAAGRLARLLPGTKLIVTGGEPTLRADLADLLRALAGIEGLGLVELQTNAVLLRRHSELIQIPPERMRVLVALHSMDTDLYDRCTRSHGMLEASLASIDWLLDNQRKIEINCVVTSLNLYRLADYIEKLFGRFASRCPTVHFSVMGVPENKDASEWQVPYGDMVEQLGLARRKAAEAGISTLVAWSASHAAVPPCLLGGQEKVLHYHGEHEGIFSADEPAKWWYKPESCKPCKWFQMCPGVGRSYADRFGVGELKPVLS